MSTTLAPIPDHATVGRRMPAARDLLVVLGVAAAVGAAAGARPLLVLLIGAAVIVGAAVLLRPDVATVVVVFLLYSNVIGVMIEFHGLTASVGIVLPMLLIAPLMYHVLVREERFRQPPAFGWVLVFLFVQLLATIFATDVAVATGTVQVFIFEGLVVYLLVPNVIRTSRLLVAAVWAIVIAAAMLSVISIIQVVLRDYGNDFLGFAQTSEVAQQRLETGEKSQVPVEGPIGDKNRYAQLLLVAVPLGLFLYWSARSTLARLGGLLAAVITSLAVFFTLSRGAALGFLVLLVVMTFLRYIRVRHLVTLLVALTVLLVAVPAYKDRISTLGVVPALFSPEAEATNSQTDSSLRSRATEALIALLMFADHPVLGVGPGLYPAHYLEYADDAFRRSDVLAVNVKESRREAHSAYLGLLSEMGILGVCAFLGFLTAMLGALVRARRRCLSFDPRLGHLVTGILLAVVAYLATATFLHLAYIRYFWLLMGLAAAAILVVEREADEAARRPAEAP